MESKKDFHEENVENPERSFVSEKKEVVNYSGVHNPEVCWELLEFVLETFYFKQLNYK